MGIIDAHFFNIASSNQQKHQQSFKSQTT